jgi:hypothetical protein
MFAAARMTDRHAPSFLGKEMTKAIRLAVADGQPSKPAVVSSAIPISTMATIQDSSANEPEFFNLLLTENAVRASPRIVSRPPLQVRSSLNVGHSLEPSPHCVFVAGVPLEVHFRPYIPAKRGRLRTMRSPGRLNELSMSIGIVGKGPNAHSVALSVAPGPTGAAPLRARAGSQATPVRKAHRAHSPRRNPPRRSFFHWRRRPTGRSSRT